MENDLIASLTFGIGLVILGVVLIRWHLRIWRGYHEEALDEGQLRHYRAQFRRRIQVSVLLIALGVLIPLWDVLATGRHLSPIAAGIWIIGMLLLTLWIMLLAMLDWISSRVHRRAMLGALSSLARKRRDLEDEVARLRQQHRNGRG